MTCPSRLLQVFHHLRGLKGLVQDTPAHSHLETRLWLRHGQWHLWVVQDQIEPHAVLIVASQQAHRLTLCCHRARLKSFGFTIQADKIGFKTTSLRMVYLGIIDCLHPMVSPRDLVFRLLMVGRSKGRSTREKHRAVRICPAVPPLINISRKRVDILDNHSLLPKSVLDSRKVQCNPPHEDCIAWA